MNELNWKKTALDVIDEKEEVICSVSNKVWEYAEVSLKEERSCQLYVETCKKEGFEVTENFCGIPTAFAASFGKGSPRIGILAEYDALSGLSQTAAVTEAKERIPGGNGHGCGHNMLGAGALAAAIGIRAYLEKSGKSGTVILYGCPGEEGWASKAYMAREGVWESLDAALTWHPSDCNEVVTGSSNSCLQHLYKFQGVASHASGAPEKGRSALDAVELMNIGVQFLREHMGDKARVHYSIIDAGGSSPNVVQPRASVLYFVRENHIRDAMELQKRVDKIAEGAALMTDTTFEKVFVDGLADTVTNRTLEKVLYRNFSELPLPEYTDEEYVYTDALADTYGGWKEILPGIGTPVDEGYADQVRKLREASAHAMNDFLLPHFWGNCFEPGSTDVGDVSWNCPTAQIHVASWPNGQAGHSWQNVSCGASTVGQKSAVHAGKVLACSAIELFEDPKLIKEARQEFELRTKNGYICPFPAEARPKIIF